MKKHSISNSLQVRIPILVAAMVLPLMLLLVLCNVYSAHLLQRQAADLGRNTISLFGSQVESILALIERSLLGTDLEGNRWDAPNSSPEDQRTLAQMRIRLSLNELLGTYSFLDGIFTYSPEDDTVTASTVNYSDLQKKKAVLDRTLSFSRQFEAGKVTNWEGVQIGDSYYLLRILRRGGYDIGVWVDISKFFSYTLNAEIQKLDYVGLVSADGSPLFSGYPDFHRQFSLEQSESAFGTYKNGTDRYNTIAVPIRNGSLSIVALLRNSSILQGMSVLQNAIMGVTAVLFLLAPLFLYLINRRVVRPAKQIASAMQGLGRGDLSIRFPEQKVYDEFLLIGSTFNQMACEISRLKIEAYEKQLSEQRTELQFLQLQLTPHFYINSLNVIYGLAQVSDFDTIRQMVLALTEYFRYSLKTRSDLASLKDELRHVRSYVTIQKMRYSDRLSVSFEIEPLLEDARLPLFLLQTFVENSMKYGFRGDDPVLVSISVHRVDGGRSLLVDIRDNGPGYPAEVLDGSLMKDPDNPHVGIENVQNRLALLYHGEASLVLSNLPGGGARAVIRIPYLQGGNHVSSSTGG